MFDRAKALENAYKKLQRQEEALKATLAEIDYISKNRPELVSAIANLKTKRDRQAIAIKATEQLVEFYKDEIKKNEPEIPGLVPPNKRR